ncbi:MAG: FKBP-type peptidyl-prolyl cis-trans isomerase [Gemmatimonadales bacterium]|nr:FKBP-type peptidyl-prolyl cis-trans isomerase [Gemmatimonadales bacterium]
MLRFTGSASAVVTFLVLTLIGTGCQGQKEEAAEMSFKEILPGLSYVDSLIGDGDLVGPTDFVVVHYTGWVHSEGGKGDPFDSSVERGEPISFPLGRSFVIQGWEKGVPGMRVGGKRTLLIDHELAYGVQGRPPVIPPSATLLFDVEVMGVPKVQIEVLEEGSGPEAESGDSINVHYTGWLWKDGAKGEQFDSSHKRGQPFQFTLGQGKVIQGWDSALEGMKVGQKASLIIPPELGYGTRGSGGSIPPNSTLCFEVELVSIEGK